MPVCCVRAPAPAVQIVWLLLVQFLSRAAYWSVYMAALPGLRFWPSAVLIQTNSAVASVLPAGGAFAVGITYEMLGSWGFSNASITELIGVSGIWNFGVKLTMPTVSVLLLLATGVKSHQLVVAAAAGLAICLACKEGSSGVSTRESPTARRRTSPNSLRQSVWRRGASPHRCNMSPATAKMAGTARLARMKHDVTADKRSQGADGGPAGGRRSAPIAAKAAAINAAQQRPLSWKAVIKRVLVVAMAGLAIYLVLPRLASVLGAWPRLSTLSPIWFSVSVAAELASFTCNFALQRLALQTKGWFAAVTAGLAGNAVTNSLPGGDAAGAAVQFRMLTTAGFDTDTAVGALTTFSLLGVGGLLALPLLAMPAILAGAPVSPGLTHTALLGIAGFVLFTIFGAVLLYTGRWSSSAAPRRA